MGFVNYIVLKKYKLMFEVSRDTQGTDDYKSLFDYGDSDDFVDGHITLKNLTAKHISFLMGLQDAVIGIRQDELLCFLLKSYDDVDVVSEYHVSEHKNEFEGFVVVRRE